jgi:DNA segregation ATPase FtsK/SpoIIIE-like protein
MLKFLKQTGYTTLAVLAIFTLMAFIAAWPFLAYYGRYVAIVYAICASLAAIGWLALILAKIRYGFTERKAESITTLAENNARQIEAAAHASLVQAKATSEARLLSAQARKAEREAELFVITAAQNEQVLISDGNPQGRFVAAHLALSGEVNGRRRTPTELEAATWQAWHAPAAKAALPQTTEATPPPLPDKIDLLKLIPPTGPTIEQIALGVMATKTGIETLAAPLAGMVHVGIGGSSGWGKSVLLQALALQIALAPELAELCLIDIEAQTFSPFATLGRDRLRYPLADNEADIIAILDDLKGEWERRRQLFQAHPQAADLADYNRLANEPLPYITLMIDEVNMLTGDKAIVGKLTRLGQGTRKYGLYCVLGGQNWNADDIPTKLRNNFSTRIQLKAMSKTQSRVMLEANSAADIQDPGRAFAVLPGRGLCEIQTPWVDKPTLARVLATILTAATAAPPTAAPTAENRIEENVIARYLETGSLSQAFRLLYELQNGALYTKAIGGNQTAKVKAILTRHNIAHPVKS